LHAALLGLISLKGPKSLFIPKERIRLEIVVSRI
jgi:hypothetical protein